MTGQQIGELTVIALGPKSKDGRAQWYCRCSCGNEVLVKGKYLRNGDTRSCGHLRGKTANYWKDLTGKTFGKLTVLSPTEKRSNGSIIWRCKCECGTICERLSSSLLQGVAISCGCIHSKGEQLISYLLQQNNINYETQKTFQNCRFSNTNYLARFDFYLPDYNCLIEFDGKQHFEYTSGWNTKKNFEKIQQHDIFKNQWCKNNNIALIRIPYTYYESLCIDDLIPKTTKFLV